MAGDYHIEDIYQGGYSSLNPEYGSLFTGYRINASSLGTPSAPPGQQGDLITNLSKSISTGQKVVELSLLNPEIIDSIPKQHMAEARKMAEIAGVEVTVHGPLVEASGATDRGYDEQQRKLSEQRILQAMERSHELDSKGNISVTFHTTNGAPGPIWQKEKGKPEEVLMMPVVNQETGQIGIVRKEEKYYPGIGKEVKDVNDELRIMNNSEWINNLTQIETYKKDADELMSGAVLELAPIFKGNKKITAADLNPNQQRALGNMQKAEIFLDNVQSSFNSLYNKAYKYSDEDSRKKLGEIHSLWQKETEFWKKDLESNNKDPTSVRASLTFRESELLDKSISAIKEIYRGNAPKLFKPAEEYTIQKGSQSFGNAAWESYKKFKEKSPVMNIENPPAGFGLSRADDVKNMVEMSRNQFVKRAVEKGMSENDAKRQAEKLIGATWDLGHINQLRKFGFSGKDIIKEAEKIKPYVKHVHLSDNFGAENTELPPGMGNVDFKEVMEKLGKKGKDAKKIVEAFHWVQSQKSSPFDVSLQALGSPLYGQNTGIYWNQIAGLQQGYFGGYGMTFPQINYETFGAGFSNLPSELGGQRQGSQGSRMSGRPME